MYIVVPKERGDERRVAIIPEVVPRLIELGHTVVVESGAGDGALKRDEDYVAAGAEITTDLDYALADAVLSVQAPDTSQVQQLRPGTVVVSFLPTSDQAEVVRAFARVNITSFAFELLPRISRAQPMDALSSQALVAGYRAALEAAERLPRFLPMYTTAAGTLPPARVLVLGAGVAGLQAIATARRMGALVEAYDVRSAAAEEVESLGGSFVKLDLEALEGAGGYAKEMSEDRSKRQQALLAPHVAKADAVICTAAVPGRPAPVLLTTEMVSQMRPGSVIIDIAAETGGNCEITVAGQEKLYKGVTVWGATYVGSKMAVHASQMYAQNVLNFLALLAPDGELNMNLEDELVRGTCLTHDGEVRHSGIRNSILSRAVENRAAVDELEVSGRI